MLLKGTLLAESPIYRGNARKTLFTRDGDGKQRLVSLAGEIDGTAQSLMDAFTGRSKNGKNLGLLDNLWYRLFEAPMPNGLINKVNCSLSKSCYSKNRFFDLRMGIKLDEDRGAAEANANYKMETIYKNAIFDITFQINDGLLRKEDNEAKLTCLLKELEQGRFWFGAGKSKGLGRCRLILSAPLPEPKKIPQSAKGINHLTIPIALTATNPVLVGWNFGKIDPDVPAFVAIEGKNLLEGMKSLPDPIKEKLSISIGGTIPNQEEFVNKLEIYVPKAILSWIKESSAGEKSVWVFPEADIDKLGKGKYPLTKKQITKLKQLSKSQFETKEDAEKEFQETMGPEAKKAKRALTILKQENISSQDISPDCKNALIQMMSIKEKDLNELISMMSDEKQPAQKIEQLCKPLLNELKEQIQRQMKMLQSDAWIDTEIAIREEHMLIKTMIENGKISQWDWGDPNTPPKGIKSSTWKEFMESHSRVQYKHMTNRHNLEKSITNDKNFIEFLKSYRNKTRQELAQPNLTDFRAGGTANREISKKYGKPFDTVFMRMLTWKASDNKEGWEVFIPGSTIKGALKKRASQILKTLWGEDKPKTKYVLERLFGAQSKRGLLFCSDAYLMTPDNPDKVWCAMDGVRMDPFTAKPIEEAKCDYLFAYGKDLSFHCRLDMQDIEKRDKEVLTLMSCLLDDFRNGFIPIGGEKTCGFGWLKAQISALEWLTTESDDIGKMWFQLKNPKYTKEGIWNKLNLNDNEASKALMELNQLSSERETDSPPPKAREGFISHRSFGGNCGTLHIEGEIISPINIKESGQPSWTKIIDNEHINGWDFFSMSSPELIHRDNSRTYAIPSKTLKGMIRHIYAISSDSFTVSPNIGTLNPLDRLFGWVGRGPNQALMGRVSFDFGMFNDAELKWTKIPYPYGSWQFIDGQWQQKKSGKGQANLYKINDFRVFPTVPLAPCVQSMDDFQPDTVQASYLRTIQPGAKFNFSIKFWNLEQSELERLIWCVVMDPDMYHKLGQGRYLGLGSLKLSITKESHIINWTDRYSGKNWKQPIKLEDWINPKVIANQNELKKLFMMLS